ncbi:MAG: hypothetical protein WKF77_22400 [Planctomycetaceae bacterium]
MEDLPKYSFDNVRISKPWIRLLVRTQYSGMSREIGKLHDGF